MSPCSLDLIGRDEWDVLSGLGFRISKLIALARTTRYGPFPRTYSRNSPEDTKCGILNTTRVFVHTYRCILAHKTNSNRSLTAHVIYYQSNLHSFAGGLASPSGSWTSGPVLVAYERGMFANFSLSDDISFTNRA